MLVLAQPPRQVVEEEEGLAVVVAAALQAALLAAVAAVDASSLVQGNPEKPVQVEYLGGSCLVKGLAVPRFPKRRDCRVEHFQLAALTSLLSIARLPA